MIEPKPIWKSVKAGVGDGGKLTIKDRTSLVKVMILTPFAPVDLETTLATPPGYYVIR